MSTELGAFAVLSNLLLYLTDLMSRHPLAESKKAKWMENVKNQVNAKHRGQHGNSVIRPTKFQLLQSRFMNNNRESYRKKAREVGRLITKEKPNKNGVNSMISRLERASLAEKEIPEITSQEKGKWIGSSGKNTVKNILKKFLAAEEKETNEKQPAPWKKELNHSLPKIISRNSVLSKLKEKFEQTGNICSSIEVKRLLPLKSEKKKEKATEEKSICKAEIKVLGKDLSTAVTINSLQPQLLVCVTVPTPKFCVATEIKHPWSWATNAKHAAHPYEHKKPEVEGGKATQKTPSVWPGENETPESKGQEGYQKGQPQSKPAVETEEKDNTEINIASVGPVPNEGSIPHSYETKSSLGSIPTLSNGKKDHKHITPSPGTTVPSFGDKNEAEVNCENSISDTCRSSSPSEVHEHKHQEIQGDEIPSIPKGMCSPKETEIELTGPVKELSSASQKCFSKNKASENIPLSCSPVAQPSCIMGPSSNAQQPSVELSAVEEGPQLKPNEETSQDYKKTSNTVDNKERLPVKDEVFSTPTKDDHGNERKMVEPKPMRNQGKLTENQTDRVCLPQKPQSQQKNQDNSRPNIPGQTSEANDPYTLNNSYKEKSKTIKGINSFEKHLHPLTSNPNNSCCPSTGNISKDKVNEEMNSGNNNKEQGSLSHSGISQSLSEDLISPATHNLEENPDLWSEKCDSTSTVHPSEPKGHIVEVISPRHNVGNLQTPPMNEPTEYRNYTDDHKGGSYNSEKCHFPSQNEFLKPKGIPQPDNTTSSNFHNDLVSSKNNPVEDNNANYQKKKYQSQSTTDPRKYKNETAGGPSLMNNAEEECMPLGNKTGMEENVNVRTEGKSQKSSLPLQSETALDPNGTTGNRNVPREEEKRKEKMCQVLQKKEQEYPRPSPVNRENQEDRSAEEKKSELGEKKMLPNSQLPQTPLKNGLVKDGGNKTGSDISPAQDKTPPEPKTSKQGMSNSLENSKYQKPSSNLVKEGAGRGRETNTEETCFSLLKEPVKCNEKDGGKSAQDNLTGDKTSSTSDKVKSKYRKEKTRESNNNCEERQVNLGQENKAENMRKSASNSGQNQVGQENKAEIASNSGGKEVNVRQKNKAENTSNSGGKQVALRQKSETEKKRKSTSTFGDRQVTLRQENKTDNMRKSTSNSGEKQVTLRQENKTENTSNSGERQVNFRQENKAENMRKNASNSGQNQVGQENKAEIASNSGERQVNFGQENKTDDMRKSTSTSGGKQVALRPENKTENTNSCGESRLPLKYDLPKSKGTIPRERSVLPNLKEDQISPSDEGKSKPMNPAAPKPWKQFVKDSGSPKTKCEIQAPQNCKNNHPILSDVKPDSHQNKVVARNRSPPPPPPKNDAKPKSNLDYEKYRRPSPQKYYLPSSHELEMYETNASENRGSLRNSEKCKVPLSNHDRGLQKEKTKWGGTDAVPKLQSLKICSAEQSKTQLSLGKYQILSAKDLPVPDNQRSGATMEGGARALGVEKYKAESYSEGSVTSSFKPMVIRVIDTIKLED